MIVRASEPKNASRSTAVPKDTKEQYWIILNNFHGFRNFRQSSNLFSQIWLKKRHTSLFPGICREIRTNFHQKFAENIQNLTKKWKNRKFRIRSRKNVDDFWLKSWDLSGAKVCTFSKSCRSRHAVESCAILKRSFLSMYVIATVSCPNFHFSVSPHVPFLNLLFEQIAIPTSI